MTDLDQRRIAHILMGNYQSQVDAVAREVQKKIMELDVMRDVNREAVQRVEAEPHRLERETLPEGVDNFETAKRILFALSEELRSMTVKANEALRRADSITAQQVIEQAVDKASEHQNLMVWVRKLADVALDHGSDYATLMSQRALKTMIPAPIRCGVLCCGHTCCLPFWDSKWDKWLW